MLEREFGRLDGLVHCAAHFKGFSRLEDLEPREWLDALQVNLTAPYTLTRLCLPLLRKSTAASVVYVMDEGGREPKPFQHIYGASKRAAEGMMLTWAQELKAETTLRFNTVDPGAMRTALRAKGYMSEVLGALPLPAEKLSRLLWLLGADSAGVSGQTF
jgi:NAD(P)-dependent dehydrogenase (short-subunit alcohol dehydrogenase family)